jgi:hypothetical protein
VGGHGLRLLLVEIGRALAVSGGWPTFGHLDRALDRSHGLDAAELLHAAPGSLVVGDRRWAGSQRDAVYGLTVRGLCAAGCLVEVGRLVRAVAWLAEAERVDAGAAEGDLTVRGSQIVDGIDVPEADSDLVVQQLYAMVRLSAPQIWSGLSGDPDSWSVTLKRDVRRGRGVTSVKTYVERMDPASGTGRDHDTERGGPDPLTALLDGVEGLRQLAMSLQADQSADPPPSSTADVLRDDYQRWYAQGLAQLPADLRDRFRGEYEGSTWTHKIRHFLEEPFATNDEAKAFFANSDGPSLPFTHWQNPVERAFVAPLNAQALLLREAQHRVGESTESTPDLLVTALARIGHLARALTARHAGREPFVVSDEYDLQDLVRSLLAALFDDVRAEDPMPAKAGASSRVDFVLPEIATLVELKFVKDRGRDRSVGEELLIDIGRYRLNHPGCNRLVALVYDPDRLLANPAGLRKDLARDDAEFTVEVVVAH